MAASWPLVGLAWARRGAEGAPGPSTLGLWLPMLVEKSSLGRSLAGRPALGREMGLQLLIRTFFTEGGPPGGPPTGGSAGEKTEAEEAAGERGASEHRVGEAGLLRLPMKLQPALVRPLDWYLCALNHLWWALRLAL